MTLPNFLVIGAQRAGTTLLHAILEAHPEVYVPRQRKEIHFFDWYYGRGETWYRQFFPSTTTARAYPAVGEATADYLATPEAPERIHALLPDCRLIAILREPISRACSWYLYNRRSYNERRSFEMFLEHDPTTLEWGLYHRHFTRYLALFPREQLCVLIYEELIAEPATGLAALARFLGLQQDWPVAPAQLLERRVNTSEAPRFRRAFTFARRTGELLMLHNVNVPVRLAKQLGVPRLFGKSADPPELAEPTRARLRTFFEDDVRALEDMLGRSLTTWRH